MDDPSFPQNTVEAYQWWCDGRWSQAQFARYQALWAQGRWRAQLEDHHVAGLRLINAQPGDVDPPVPVATDWREVVGWLLVLLVIAAIFAFGYFFLPEHADFPQNLIILR
jgi:hypothetical protein